LDDTKIYPGRRGQTKAQMDCYGYVAFWACKQKLSLALLKEKSQQR